MIFIPLPFLDLIEQHPSPAELTGASEQTSLQTALPNRSK